MRITPPSSRDCGNHNVAKPRILGLDILRTLAIVCVIGGHYFINTDFNSTPFVGIGMFVLGMLQTFTLIGVPLFMMLTGFLNLNKIELNKKFYKRIWRVIIAYIAFSVITILFREYYLHEHNSAITWLLKITDFSAIPYAWYIEMWIGLFLFTPFFNRLWDALTEKKTRIILIVTLFACCSLPDFTNRYGLHILPGYWKEASYPLLAFYCGAYIKTYRPIVNTSLLISIITALCMLNPIASIVLHKGEGMLHLQGGPEGIVSMPLAVCVVLLFYQANIENTLTRGLITKISLLSLDMYLCAWCFDKLLYPLWYSLVGSSQHELMPWYGAIVLSLLMGSFFTAWIKDSIETVLDKMFHILKSNIKRNWDTAI